MRTLRASTSTLVNTVLVVLLLLNIVTWQFTFYHLERKLAIHFFAVGQGDSFLVVTPDKVSMLVDGGPDNSALYAVEQKLLPWDSLDVVMVSHPDADHVGALAAILAKYKVKDVIFNKIEHENSDYKSFLEKLKNEDTQLHSVRKGDVFVLGCCVGVTILWPKSLYTELDVNDTSVGISLNYGNFRLFSAGDLSATYEKESVENLSKTIHVLKVGHHGSKTSSSTEFLEIIKPEIAVIQVGEDNKYGHPHADTLQNLGKFTTKILRTDTDGEVSIFTNGDGYKLTTRK